MISTDIIHCDFYLTADGRHFDTLEEAECHVRICNDPENNKPICASNKSSNYWDSRGGYPTEYIQGWYND